MKQVVVTPDGVAVEDVPEPVVARGQVLVAWPIPVEEQLAAVEAALAVDAFLPGRTTGEG